MAAYPRWQDSLELGLKTSMFVLPGEAKPWTWQLPCTFPGWALSPEG